MYKSAEDRKAYAREYMRRWGQTPQGQRSRTARTLRRRCGLTLDEYEKTFEIQLGKCQICGVEKPRYGKERLVADHCHKSGKFRALLCSQCNAGIGCLKEDVTILKNAIVYLQEVGA